MSNNLLWIAVLLPLIGAVFAYALGRRRARYALWGMLAASLATLIPLSVLFWQAANGQTGTFTSAGLCTAGLSLFADGFRALYAWLSALLWVAASVFSFSYFREKEQNIPRFAFFSLITLSAAVGLFLSDQLQTTVLFFEVMSLASYPLVAHNETPEAMRAAQSYLWIAVIGGLCVMMGMLLLPGELLAARYSAGLDSSGVSAQSLMLPAILMLVGFGAKAGAFPLHVWLPKAYPAAPAPATALLSAVLSKAGVFGILVLSVNIMREVAAWHLLIFWIGVATMLLGGLWALLSMNIKRVLAYSSMSQIGFILVGIGLYGMLARHGGIAAQGLAAHMVNHSVFKMILFISAGVIVMNVGKRHLNDLRGFGRGKPLLHILFLSGMLGIAGVPLFSGFASKSLLHESLTEYIRLSGGTWLYSAAEWIFILSGGLTLAYMLKLYICLFWEHPEATPVKTPYISRASAITLSSLAVFPLLMGVFPSVFIDALGRTGADFLRTEAQAVEYFSAENLLGAAYSIGAGLLIYILVVRGLLSEKTEGGRGYMNPVPARVNLEDMVYRPALRGLTTLVGWFSWAVSLLPEAMVAGLRRAFLHVRAWRVPMPGGNRFTYAVGDLMNGCVSLLNRTVLKNRPASIDFSVALAAGNEVINRSMKRLKRSLSYSLLLFCIGLFGLLVYLIFFK